MTALFPTETRLVKGVPATKYKANKVCAHPECAEAVPDRGHHIFPRSQIGNSSYFVEIGFMDGTTEIMPHVTGLCRPHHEDVEAHRAWIKLENGEFVWYERRDEEPDGSGISYTEYLPLGPLDPQPGGRAKSRKPRKRHTGEAKRQRKTISVRVPDDAAENGAGLLDDYCENLEAALGFDPARPRYYTLIDALALALLHGLDDH